MEELKETEEQRKLKVEVANNWAYFCSLCKMLDDTTQYIDHSNEANKSVNSFEFQKIIVLVGIEFEAIGKQLCVLLDKTKEKKIKRYKIVEITDTIIKNYKEIKDIEIEGLFYKKVKPLENWNLRGDDNNTKRKIVDGLEWWKAYNGLKHGRDANYKEQATLENAQNALAALMVLEITYVKKLTGRAYVMDKMRCSYFNNPCVFDIIYEVVK